MQVYVRDGAFFSGDGGIKLLASAQFARGEWTTEMRLPAQPWEAAIWGRGYFPFRPPFAYEIAGRQVFGVPLVFSAASAPFYAWLGYRGLYLLPLAALFVIGIRTQLLTRRLGLSVGASTLVYGSLLFGSFLTLYSATFWEHLPATALASLGLATVLEDWKAPVGLRSAGLSGGGLGLSAWLRPEGFCLALLAVLVWAYPAWRRHRWGPWLSFSSATAAMLALFVLVNLALYGHPLGTHALQVLQAPDDRLAQAWVHLRLMAWGVLRFAPVSVLLIYLAIRLLGVVRQPQAASVFYAVVVSALFVPGIALIVPNEGGLQWGPRYALAIVPLVCWGVGLAWDTASRAVGPTERRWLVAAAVVLVGYGVWLNGWNGTRELARNYRERVQPAIERVRRSEIDQVVVADQFIAQEMASLMGDKRFYLLSEQGEQVGAQLAQLAQMFHEAGRRRFFLIVALYAGSVNFPDEVSLERAPVRWAGKLLGRFGDFYRIYEFAAAPTRTLHQQGLHAPP
jgi:hypothetical protein